VGLKVHTTSSAQTSRTKKSDQGGIESVGREVHVILDNIGRNQTKVGLKVLDYALATLAMQEEIRPRWD